MAVFLPATGSTGINNQWYWHSTASWFNPTASDSVGAATTLTSFQQATALPGLNDEVFLVTPWTLRQTMNVSLRAMTGSLRVKKIHQRTTGSWSTISYLSFNDFDTNYNVIEATNGLIPGDFNLDNGGTFVSIATSNIHSGINLTISASIWAGCDSLLPIIPINISNSNINISGSIYQSSALASTVSVQVNGYNNLINIYGDVVGGANSLAVPAGGVINIASSYNTLNIYGNLYNSSSTAAAGGVISVADTYVGNTINVYGGPFRPITSINNNSVVTTLNTLRNNMETRAGSPLIRVISAAGPTVPNNIILGTETTPLSMYNSGTGSLVISTTATAQVISTVDTTTTAFIYANPTFQLTATGSKIMFNVPRIYITSSNIAIVTSSVANGAPYAFGQSNISDPTPATTDVYIGVAYGSNNSKTGVLTTPSSSNVRSTITYSSGSVGATPSSIPGIAAIPPQNDVRFGIRYSTVPSGGTMIVPIASQVSASFGFESYNVSGSYSGSKTFWATPHVTMTTGIGALISQSLNVRVGSVTGSLISLLDTDTSNTVTRLRSIAGVADVGNALTQSAMI
jgi:hypothetical protein